MILHFEHTKQDSFSQIKSTEHVIIANDINPIIYRLFEADQENSIEIKNYWEEGDLLSQKRYCSSNEKFFHNF